MSFFTVLFYITISLDYFRNLNKFQIQDDCVPCRMNNEQFRGRLLFVINQGSKAINPAQDICVV